MPTCETIQIAHEMHVHGAPAALSTGDVDQHVTTCADCRAYVAESKRIDAMTTFAIPELEFARLRSDVVERRLPRLRRELYLGFGFVVFAVLYGALSGHWGGPIGAAIGCYFTLRTVERRSRRLERAMLSNGRELLVEMRADLRREIELARNTFLVFPVAALLTLLWAIAQMGVHQWSWFVLSIVAGIFHLVWTRKRERELESLG